MNQVGLQIWTIRDYFKFQDMARMSFKKMADIGYTQAQTAGLYGMTPKEYYDAAHDAGIEIVGTHAGWDAVVKDPDQTMRDHEILGTTNIGIGAMPGFATESKENLLRFIDLANEFAAKVNKHGFKFTYHNHSFEFKKIDGKTIFDYLVEGFDPNTISFVLDTYWVQHGGADVRATIERLAGRIDILHLKDMAACGGDDGKVPYYTSIGNGNIDFKAIVPLAEKTGVKYFVVEQDRYWRDNDPFKSIQDSYDYIKANLM